MKPLSLWPLAASRVTKTVKSLTEAVTDPPRRSMVLVMLLRSWVSTQVEMRTTVGLQGKMVASHICTFDMLGRGCDRSSTLDCLSHALAQLGVNACRNEHHNGPAGERESHHTFAHLTFMAGQMRRIEDNTSSRFEDGPSLGRYHLMTLHAPAPH